MSLRSSVSPTATPSFSQRCHVPPTFGNTGFLSPNDFEDAQLRAVTWRSYMVDVVVGLVFGLIALLIHADKIVTPHVRGYFQNDTSIYLPYNKKGTVSSAWLVIFSFVLPLLVILFFAVFVDKAFTDRVRFRRFFWRPFTALYFVEIFTSIVTDMVKNQVGRLRPDFIGRCQPDYSIPGVVVDTISTYVAQPYVCTGATSAVLDGRRSFPSGHSSASFVGATFLSIFLYQRLYALALPKWPMLIRPFDVASPLIAAAAIAVSRSTDNRHHSGDIAAGSVLGVLAGLSVLLFTGFAPDAALGAFYPVRYEHDYTRLCDQHMGTTAAAAGIVSASVPGSGSVSTSAQVPASAGAAAAARARIGASGDGHEDSQSLIPPAPLLIVTPSSATAADAASAGACGVRFQPSSSPAAVDGALPSVAAGGGAYYCEYDYSRLAAVFGCDGGPVGAAGPNDSLGVGAVRLGSYHSPRPRLSSSSHEAPETAADHNDEGERDSASVV